jgi:nitrogen fixation NifU-like protein
MDNELYQEVLLQYARRPVNFGPLEHATHEAEGYNAMCGDEIAVALKVEDGKVSEAKFTGSSCAICTASACLMTGEIRGLTCDAACKLASSFRGLIREGSSPDVTEKLRLLDRVHQFPQRVKCAVLPWETMVQALGSPQT